MSRKIQQLHMIRFLLILLAIALRSNSLLGATAVKKKKRIPARTSVKSSAIHRVTKAPARPSAMSLVARRSSAKRPLGVWRVPTYADSTEGDFIDGDDLVVRRAAVEALGPLNGSVVVSDPSTGRVLTIVNQRLAYQNGYQPCSTVKIPVALAALSESVIDRQTLIRVYGRTKFDMTSAIAKSNNQYFANLGERLGFDRVSYYAASVRIGRKSRTGYRRRAGRHPTGDGAEERHRDDDQLRRRNFADPA